MLNVIYTTINVKTQEVEVRTDSINAFHTTINSNDIKLKTEFTPIFFFDEQQDIYKISECQGLGFEHPPVILLFKDQENFSTEHNQHKFTFFTIDKGFPEKGEKFDAKVENVWQELKEAREIGIAHDQVLPKGFLGSESEVSLKFYEDDPKKYFKAFMEFAAYGSNGNEEAHKKAIKAYWKKLLDKFTDHTKYDKPLKEEIIEKFGIPERDFNDIFSGDGTINIKKLQKYSKEKLQESGITNENQSIYHGKHKFTAENRRDGRLYIKSSGDFDGGLFANGVTTIFGGFDSTQNDLLQEFITNPDQKIEGLDVRLITAVTESMHQLKQIQKTDDLKNKNVVHRGVFLEKPSSPSKKPKEPVAESVAESASSKSGPEIII
jgi:hypothetical protein